MWRDRLPSTVRRPLGRAKRWLLGRPMPAVPDGRVWFDPADIDHLNRLFNESCAGNGPLWEPWRHAHMRLPAWFTERFPAEYHRKRLFEESPGALLHAAPFENRTGAPMVSTPERALLEMLSEVGVRQPLQEARELTESTYSLRADVLRELLRRERSAPATRQ